MKTLTKATLVTLMALTTGAALALPPGSYIRKPVRTVEQLVNHAATDPVVMDRYQRQFRKSRNEILDYFRTLHLAKLNRAGAYTVFNVHDGVLRSKPRMLKKGALVFADSNGRPILLQVCGNPMVWDVPKLGSKVDVTASAVERDFVGATEAVVAENTVEPGVSPVIETALPQAPIAPAAQVGSITSGGANYLPLLALGVVPFLFNNGGDDEPPPVPEPATMTMLVVGAAGFIARKRRK